MTQTSRMLVLAIAAVAALPGRADCPLDWFPGASLIGANGNVRAITHWDPDGDGPMPELLVVGGEFTAVGDTNASRVAAWNGDTWYPLGSGMNDWVTALAVVGGELFAGGSFTIADGQLVNRVARWTGFGWAPVGGGVGGTMSFPYVFALQEFNGELVAAGIFNQAGTTAVSNIARWNGEQWLPLAGGLNSYVYSLITFGGELIAGGAFDHAGGVSAQRIAAWNGQAWRPLGGGLTGPGVGTEVRSMVLYNGALAVGGNFTNAGSAGADGVAQWDGQAWSGFGFGISRPYTLCVQNGQLIAAGRARWNGQSWESITQLSLDYDVYASAEYRGELIAGGSFQRGSNRDLLRIARFDGAAWQQIAPGFEISIECILVRDGDVIVGGNFSTAPDGTPAQNVARWDGAAWHALGAGLPGIVKSITEFNGELVVSSNRIYRWDGATWVALNETLGGFGTPYAVAVFNNELIVAGVFTTIDDVLVWNIARWNGVEWRSIGDGIQGEEVFALLVHNGELYAAGDFWQAGGISAWNVAAWNGTTWRNLGQGLSSAEDPIRSLTEFNGEVVAGGSFFRGVARWTGTAWVPFGDGVDRPVNAVHVHDGVLYAGGLSRDFPGVFRGIARWDGAAWSNVAGGTDSDVRALASRGEDLLLGGVFASAGNRVAGRFARYGPRLLGDLDLDGDVDLSDLTTMLSAFGTCPLDVSYDRESGELAGDPCVLLEDLTTLLAGFGRTCE